MVHLLIIKLFSVRATFESITIIYLRTIWGKTKRNFTHLVVKVSGPCPYRLHKGQQVMCKQATCLFSVNNRTDLLPFSNLLLVNLFINTSGSNASLHIYGLVLWLGDRRWHRSHNKEKQTVFKCFTCSGAFIGLVAVRLKLHRHKHRITPQFLTTA